MTENIKISPEAVSLISSKFAFEHNVLPIKLEKDILHIGITDKNDLKLINDLTFSTGLSLEIIELPPDLILRKLKEVYPDNEFKSNGNGKEYISDNLVSDYSNVDFVNQLISGAIKSSASDIHFEVYENTFRVRYRIDGHLREVLNLSPSKSPAILSRLKIMANLDISEKRRPQDGRIRFAHRNNVIDIRVSSLPTNFGEKIVLRILDKSQLKLDLNKLGLDKEQLSVFTTNLKYPYGMILVTGPTGSGKTTTLYAALQHIHSPEKNILTVEDPIEYNLSGINQSNVKPDIGYDFASALRAFLRQDPDVVMVGEIRDKETAEIAIRASLTGHLVFSTLHTNDSISAVTRLIDMGVEPYLVASSVRLIIAQRLVRTLCSCREKSKEGTGLNEPYLKTGCEKCSFTGYKGRIALFELVEIDEKLSELISRNASLSEIRNAARENGFKSLRDSGIDKISGGVTTYEEVLRETML